MTIFRSKAVAALVLMAVLPACGRNNTYDVEAEAAKLRAEFAAEDPPVRQPPTDEGWPFDVASDAKATYRLLFVRRINGNHLEVLTRRDGPSGTSFSRIEVSCASATYRGLGEGDTREDAMQPRYESDKFIDLVPGSIKDVTVAFSCRKSLE